MPRLLQFKAGRCTRRGETNMVDPLPGKGLLYIEQSDDDGLCHLCFKDLEAGTVVDDLILFSGDAAFSQVPHPSQSPSRIYVLKFSSSDQRLLFWMQSTDASTDARNARRLNQLIDDPTSVETAGEDDAMAVDALPAPAPASSQPTETVGAAASSEPSSAPSQPAPAAPPTNADADSLTQLQSFIASFNAQQGQQGGLQQGPAYTLTDVLTPAALLPLLSSPSPALLATLTPYLPADVPPTAESLRRVVESIEFRRAVGSLDGALRTGALGSFVEALGLPFEAAMGVENYVEAVQKQAAQQKKGEDRMQTD